MKRNLGSIDRMLRILIAIVIAALYFTHVITGAVAVTLLVIGTIILLTGFVGICPLYSLFAITTFAKKR